MPSSVPGTPSGSASSAPLRFEPALEAEYSRTRLLENRTLIRMSCLLGLAITALRLLEFTVTGIGVHTRLSGYALVFPAVVVSTSALLAWLAWSPSFTRHYLPVANLAVPARSTVAAVGIAAIAAHGDTDLLMFLPAMVLSPFFFLGLHWRPALVSVSLMITAFAFSAIAYGLPMPMLIRACAFLVVTALTSAVAARQLDQHSRRSFLDRRTIEHLAEHDALTGVKNRRVFDEHISRLWRQACDDRRRIAIVLVDVDNFKAFNDLYGHQAGDEALRRVAEAVQAQVWRPLDLLARYGGEEFIAVLYDVDDRQAYEIAARMRHAVSGLGIEHRESRAASTLTISIGVAAIQPSPERKSHGAVQLADEALYTAKIRGRDQVHLAEEADYMGLETGVFARRLAG